MYLGPIKELRGEISRIQTKDENLVNVMKQYTIKYIDGIINKKEPYSPTLLQKCSEKLPEIKVCEGLKNSSQKNNDTMSPKRKRSIRLLSNVSFYKPKKKDKSSNIEEILSEEELEKFREKIRAEYVPTLLS